MEKETRILFPVQDFTRTVIESNREGGGKLNICDRARPNRLLWQLEASLAVLCVAGGLGQEDRLC